MTTSAVSTTPSTSSTGTTPTTTTPTTTTAPPSLDEAVGHLVAAREVLLDLWFCELPDLATQRAAMMFAAHRSVHEAMLVLDDRGGVLFPTAPIGANAGY